MVYKVGLTGGIASGKSLVAGLFSSLGACVIDTDHIAHQLTKHGEPTWQAIVDHFGDDIIDDKQQIDRKKLRKIVFNNPQQRRWLEQLLHPIILQRMQQQAEQSTADYAVFVIPLLIEVDLTNTVDRVCVVDCPEALQVKRACQRDQCDSDTVKKILSSQATRQQRVALADDIISNDDGVEKLQKQVQNLHKQYLEHCIR